jgi:hypothetical protein
MSERNPIIKEKAADIEKRRDFERSLEINYMKLLMMRNPDKAKAIIKQMNPNNSLTNK